MANHRKDSKVVVARKPRANVNALRNTHIYELFLEGRLTLEEIGGRFGVSRQRVNQIVDHERELKRHA